MDPLKPSVMSGEFLLYIVAGIVMLYLDSKGVKVDDVVERGRTLVVKASENVEHIGVVAIPFLFGAKRISYKAYRAYLQTKVEIEKIKSGISANG